MTNNQRIWLQMAYEKSKAALDRMSVAMNNDLRCNDLRYSDGFYELSQDMLEVHAYLFLLVDAHKGAVKLAVDAAVSARAATIAEAMFEERKKSFHGVVHTHGPRALAL